MSISGAVDLGLIPSPVKPMTLILVFTAFLLDVQHLRDSVENKPASLLVVPLGKALSGIPLSIAHSSLSCDRRINMQQNTKKNTNTTIFCSLF